MVRFLVGAVQTGLHCARPWLVFGVGCVRNGALRTSTAPRVRLSVGRRSPALGSTVGALWACFFSRSSVKPHTLLVSG
jgi:hypothetical protein